MEGANSGQAHPEPLNAATPGLGGSAFYLPINHDSLNLSMMPVQPTLGEESNIPLPILFVPITPQMSQLMTLTNLNDNREPWGPVSIFAARLHQLLKRLLVDHE